MSDETMAPEEYQRRRQNGQSREDFQYHCAESIELELYEGFPIDFARMEIEQIYVTMKSSPALADLPGTLKAKVALGLTKATIARIGQIEAKTGEEKSDVKETR